MLSIYLNTGSYSFIKFQVELLFSHWVDNTQNLHKTVPCKERFSDVPLSFPYDKIPKDATYCQI